MLCRISVEMISQWHFNKLTSIHICFSVFKKCFLFSSDIWDAWLVGWFYHLPILTNTHVVKFCSTLILSHLSISKSVFSFFSWYADLMVKRDNLQLNCFVRIKFGYSECDSIFKWFNLNVNKLCWCFGIYFHFLGKERFFFVGNLSIFDINTVLDNLNQLATR